MSNLSSNKKYHYLYKTVNKVNGKFYFGVHSTNNLEDGYLGSGTALRAAIRKHGKENFELTVLEYFDSRESLLEAEKIALSDLIIADRQCYNLKPGGTGGYSSESHIVSRQLARSKGHREYFNSLKYSEDLMNLHKSKISKSLRSYFDSGGKGSFTGKKHREETKKLMSEIKLGTGTGSKNSQFGTIWITDGSVNKKLKKDQKVPDGWKLGRTLKH